MLLSYPGALCTEKTDHDCNSSRSALCVFQSYSGHVGLLSYTIVANFVVPPMRRRVQPGIRVRSIRSVWRRHDLEIFEVCTQCMPQSSFLSWTSPPSLCRVILHVFLFCANPIRPWIVTVCSHDEKCGTVNDDPMLDSPNE